jgi:ABC-type branched-subunit amino acid transport system substrate-binding protein
MKYLTLAALAMVPLVQPALAQGQVAAPAPAVLPVAPAQALEDAALHLRRGDAPGALALYKQLVNNPDPALRAQARFGLALALDHTGDDVQALRALEGTPADETALGKAIGQLRAELLLQLAGREVAQGNLPAAADWLAQYDRLTVQPGRERYTRLRRRVDAGAGGLKVAELPPLKIGVLLPLSGPFKDTGQEILRGLQLGLEKQPLDRAQALVLAPYDTARGAAAAAEAALNAGAAVLAGPLLAGDVESVAAKAKNAGVPVVAFTSDRAALKGGVTSVAYLPTEQARAAADWAAGQGAHKVAGLIPSSPYGYEVYDAFRDEATRLGLEIAASSFYNPQNVDLSASVRELVGGKPVSGTAPFEALFAPAPAQSLPLVTSQLDYYDLDKAGVQLLGTGLWQNPALLKPSAQGVRGAVFAVPPKVGAVEDAYRGAFGDTPQTGGATLGYDLAFILGEAAAELRVNGMGVAETLLRPEGFYVAGGFARFFPNGGVQRGLDIVRIEADGFHVLKPALLQAPLPLPENLLPSADGKGWKIW